LILYSLILAFSQREKELSFKCTDPPKEHCDRVDKITYTEPFGDIGFLPGLK
jgi:hypothetical protein